jgi:5-methyltetrahydrofolate--homocysteine methyltransferase
MDGNIKTLFDSVIGGEKTNVEEIVTGLIHSGIDPTIILQDGLIAAMTEVGNRFECGDFFVPEMLVAARAMQGGLVILKPHLIERGIKSTGKVVIGTVKGDLHDIGKNLVAMMLEGAGFEVHDLGTDVPPDQFIAEVKKHQPEILGMSALLTTTMVYMKATIDTLVESGLRDKVKVIVGGAPVTQEYAMQIGADGYGSDASRAVSLVKSLVFI